MKKVRRRNERGYADHGWLKSFHTFSFAGYQDPRHVHFRKLRVMNEDWIEGGQGFGTHPHNDMEIVTYVLSGSLEHRDSMGNGEILSAGEFQRMTAGSGITHSEFNPSSSETAHLYQIWIFPNERNLTPSYEQKRFDPAEQLNRWRLVASEGAEDGSLKIHQDAKIYLATIEPARSLEFQIDPGRNVWLQILEGQVLLDGETLEAGDGVAITEESGLELKGVDQSQVMLFDLD